MRMNTHRLIVLASVALIGSLGCASNLQQRRESSSSSSASVSASGSASASASASSSDEHLPAAVTKTFESRFPGACIVKQEAERENGVVVYDLEFTDGNVEKEMDITADGTM